MGKSGMSGAAASAAPSRERKLRREVCRAIERHSPSTSASSVLMCLLATPLPGRHPCHGGGELALAELLAGGDIDHCELIVLSEQIDQRVRVLTHRDPVGRELQRNAPLARAMHGL